MVKICIDDEINLNQNWPTEIRKVIRSNGNQGGLRKFELETEPAGQLRLRPGQVLTRDSRWHLDSRVTAGYARGMDQGYGFIGMGVWISIKNTTSIIGGMGPGYGNKCVPMDDNKIPPALWGEVV